VQRGLHSSSSGGGGAVAAPVTRWRHLCSTPTHTSSCNTVKRSRDISAACNEPSCVPLLPQERGERRRALHLTCDPSFFHCIFTIFSPLLPGFWGLRVCVESPSMHSPKRPGTAGERTNNKQQRLQQRRQCPPVPPPPVPRVVPAAPAMLRGSMTALVFRIGSWWREPDTRGSYHRGDGPWVSRCDAPAFGA